MSYAARGRLARVFAPFARNALATTVNLWSHDRVMPDSSTPNPAANSRSGESRFTATDWLRPSVIALVLANLIPLVGVFAWGWEVFPLLLLFWFENVLIGVFNALKMLLVAPADPLRWLGKLFLVPFFCFHYGMFTFVHGIFVMGLFGGAFRQGAKFPDPASFWEQACALKLEWAIVGLAVSHAVSFGWNYLAQGEYQRASVQELMQQPYGRVVVLHLTILLGAFLMAALKSPAVGLALLVILKIGLDVRAHLRERRKFAQPQAAGPMTQPTV